MTDYSSEQHSILITGCSSGIGLCLARALHLEGYRVFATARQDEDVALLKAEGLEAFKLDLSDSANIQDVAQRVLQQCEQQLYALINNGAYGQMGAVEDLNREALRAQFECNVFGTQELSNAVLPAMRAAERGRIIHISSVLGLVCMPMRGAYCASKFALEALGDNLRLELAGSGVKVSLIEPGPVVSKFRENALKTLHNAVDIQNSAHTDRYQQEIARLQNPGPNSRFTLPPEAVLQKVQHALRSDRPRARYFVTTPTWIFATLRRLLPTKALDALLMRG
ncbi:MAG: SDR family NAD(P)-dependent oxidoreductase [Granulosicoccaceae bacterium]